MRMLVLLFFAASLFAQDAGMKARQMYLETGPDPAASGQKSGAAKATKSTDKGKDSGSKSGGSTLNATQPVVPVALHLGLRYNVLKVDPDAKAPTVEVDPKTVFKTGDCLAILLRPNRSGFMYVFNAGTTKPWDTLLPSAKMPNESNRIQAGASTQVPRDFCFKVGGAPGTDDLVVVLTEREEDQRSLDDSIRRSLQGGDKNLVSTPTTSPIGEVIIAMGGAPNGPREGQGLASRDLEIQEVGRPQSSDERPNSVYVVKTAMEKSERMVIEIKIRHE
jgi:uncharacterized protein DUF4384